MDDSDRIHRLRQELIDSYDEDARFRSKIVMARHGFGSGEYRYFAYPLPQLVEGLRTALYPRLAPVAEDEQAVAERSQGRLDLGVLLCVDRCGHCTAIHPHHDERRLGGSYPGE